MKLLQYRILTNIISGLSFPIQQIWSDIMYLKDSYRESLNNKNIFLVFSGFLYSGFLNFNTFESTICIYLNYKKHKV